MARVKLTGYAPDADPLNAGVIVNCAAMVPSMKGLKGAPGAINSPIAALESAARGAALVRKLDDTTRMFAGTSTAIWEAGASTWTDVSRTVGGDYTLGTGLKWRFAQYGNTSLAVQKADKLQFSTSSGAFENVTAAPKASGVETVGQFVFLWDTNEATYSDSPDRWWCSASGDFQDWTPSITTECATGRLIGSPGPIKSMRKFGDQIVAYKARSMHVGTYQGSPEVWRFDEVPGEIGAVSHEAVVNIGTEADPRHIFMGQDDFYSFDGSRPTPIGTGWIKETVFKEISQVYAFASIGLQDRINSRVYFYYSSGVSSTVDKCVVYNYKTGQWGRDDRTIESAIDWLSPGVTYDGLGSLYSTYEQLPELNYDSAFFSVGLPVPAVFNTSHKLQMLTGPSVSSSITTGDMGDEEQVSTITRIRPLFIRKPTSSNVANFYRMNLGDDLTTDELSPYGDGKYDILRSARWHRFRFDFTGDWEMSHLNVYAVQEGEQ